MGVFEWFIENNDTEEVDVALMFSFRNGIGESFDRLDIDRSILYSIKQRVIIKFSKLTPTLFLPSEKEAIKT